MQHFSRQIINRIGGNLTVFDDDSLQPISQGVARDGAGEGHNAPASLWIVFAILIGAPLAFAGVRGWRLTTGAGFALSAAVLVWAAFINAMGADGFSSNLDTSDLILYFLVLGAFLLGFAVGTLRLGIAFGKPLMGAVGGVATAFSVVLLRPGLLVPVYFVNWIIVALFAVFGGAVIYYRERAAMILVTSSAGSFLLALATDLILNTQKGMSRGLRFLMDRNTAHIVDIRTNGYTPPLSTRIILAVSLGLIPILFLIQHIFFREPFDRSEISQRDFWFYLSGGPDEEKGTMDSNEGRNVHGMQLSAPTMGTRKFAQLKSRFSHF